MSKHAKAQLPAAGIRRADYIGEAVKLSKAVGPSVKVTWSREDDLQQDWYRPASFSRFAGGLDVDGWPVAWTTRIACAPFGGLRDGLARTGAEGRHVMSYTWCARWNAATW